MGIGDEIMLAGEARRQAAGREMKFRMLDKRGEQRWHFVWEGNPHIARPGQPFDATIGFSAGKRPYIEDVKPNRYTFREYRPEPASIRMGPQAMVFAGKTAGAVVFNPDIKPRASPNKDWGIAHWRRLVALCKDLRWIQIGESMGRSVHGAERLYTGNFWDACGAMYGAAAVVVQEGALHHAAAAIGAKCIVIRGGFISPKVTGYAGQVDLYVESEEWPLGCGMRTPCQHCREAMDSITPERVAEKLLDLLKKKEAV